MVALINLFLVIQVYLDEIENHLVRLKVNLFGLLSIKNEKKNKIEYFYYCLASEHVNISCHVILGIRNYIYSLNF